MSMPDLAELGALRRGDDRRSAMVERSPEDGSHRCVLTSRWAATALPALIFRSILGLSRSRTAGAGLVRPGVAVLPTHKRFLRSAANGGWVSFAIHTICDAGAATVETHRHSPRHPKLVLTTTILASSLAFIDGSVVNVGLPAMSTSFHAGCRGPAMGGQRLSSAVERAAPVGRRLPAITLAVFVFWWRARLFSASPRSAAPSLPACLGCSWLAKSPGNRRRAADAQQPRDPRRRFLRRSPREGYGHLGVEGAVMGAGGPVLGGWLIDTVGWRSIFLVNIPLAVGAIVLALAFVRDGPTAGSASRWIFRVLLWRHWPSAG